jgi:dienelactone hydrolase
MNLRFASLFLTGALLGASSLSAKVVTKPIAYEHGGVKLEGWLAYDDEKTALGKQPGVLVVHEWWGLNAFVKGRAEALAKAGYVAFALDMYGAGVVTEDPAKAGELAGAFYGKPLMAERARAGLDQLLGTGLVDPARTASIGFCFGGTVSQVLAYSGAPLSGIVSFHGSPAAPAVGAGAATRAKFLILHGAVDPFIKAEDLAAFTAGLEREKIDYQFISYAGAVHAFTNPGADRIAKEKGLVGVGYNEAAAKRSWTHMRGFFKELFTP